MDAKRLLRKVAKDFDLKLISFNRSRFLVLTKREIIMRNFLCGCPDPLYVKHGNKNRRKRPLNLVKYFQTSDCKRQLKKPQACIISRKELESELSLLFRIPDEKIRKQATRMYSRIKKRMGNSGRLTLIWKPSKTEKRSRLHTEIILHELIHELMEYNDIRPKSWKWNEGLGTYVTNFALGKHKKFEKQPKLGKNKMWNIYAGYAHKWARLLKEVKHPKTRKQIILRKVNTINKKFSG